MILVTGGSGLVGSSIKELVKLNNEEYIFTNSSECDLRNANSVDNLFNKYKPSTVIHLANVVGGLYFNTNNNYRILVDNVKINTNILECCEKYKIKRLINILSTCVFGNNLKYPLTSNQMYDKVPDNSNEGYSYSKRLLDTSSKLLTKCTDIEIVNIIPTNLIGFNDNYNLQSAHVVPALIAKTFTAKNNFKTGKNCELNIKGTGQSFRQFVFSDDLAKIILHFVECKLNNQFNQLIVGPPTKDEITIKELVNKIVKEFDFKGSIIYDDNFTQGQLKKTVDDSEVLKYIPGFKFTPLNISLKKTIKYFIENYSSIRK